MKQLFTKKHRRILTFIQEYVVNKGRPPVQREIAEFLGCRSLGTVAWHLKQMEEQGLLERAGKGGEISVSMEPLNLLDRQSLKAMKNRGVSLASIAREWSAI